MVAWDEWLDQIIAYKNVNVTGTNTTVAMGTTPVFSWFTRVETNMFVDNDHTQKPSAKNDPIPQVPVTIPFRDGSISNVLKTDSSGNSGFGTKVTLGGRDVTSMVTSWTPNAITLNVPAGTEGGQLIVTAANGKSTVDAVNVTIENRVPTRVQASANQTIQAAIDGANPGDLILVDAGTYNELVIMWKPVRLQGVGATSVIINAAKYPTIKLANWRPRINTLFGIDEAGNQTQPPMSIRCLGRRSRAVWFCSSLRCSARRRAQASRCWPRTWSAPRPSDPSPSAQRRSITSLATPRASTV